MALSRAKLNHLSGIVNGPQSLKGRSVWLVLILKLIAAGPAQSVERLTAEQEVTGSFPETGQILRVLK